MVAKTSHEHHIKYLAKLSASYALFYHPPSLGGWLKLGFSCPFATVATPRRDGGDATPSRHQGGPSNPGPVS